MSTSIGAAGEKTDAASTQERTTASSAAADLILQYCYCTHFVTDVNAELLDC